MSGYKTGNTANLYDEKTGAPIGLIGLDGREYKSLIDYKKGLTIAILGCSTVHYGAPKNPVGFATWSIGDTKVAGNTVIPRQVDLSAGFWPHLYYTCMQGGVVGELEPVWPTTIGETVKDGNVIWQCTDVRTNFDVNDTPAWGVNHWNIAQQLSGQRLDEIYINGQSGKKCQDILKYLDRAISKNPDVIYLSHMFVNDAGGVSSLADIQSDWDAFEAAVDKCRAAGIKVMTDTTLPNGAIDVSNPLVPFTGYTKGNGTKAWNWLNAKLKELARLRTDVILWDAAGVYLDPNNASTIGPWPENTVTYLVASGSNNKKTDGVHGYISGMYLLGASLAQVISDNFPKVNRFSMSKDDWAISINPLNGGTGTPSAPGTGTTAANMSLASNGTVNSSVCSQVARTDISGNWVQVVYDASAGNTVQYSNTTGVNVGGNFNVGDKIQAFGEIKVNANPTLLKNVYVASRCSGGTPGFSNSTKLASTDQDLGQMITVDQVFTLKDLPRKIPAGTTTISHYLYAEFRGTSVGTVSFGRLGINKIGAVQAIA